MRIKKLIPLLFATALIGFGACKKNKAAEEALEPMPSADFATDKSEYNSGDVIQLTNKSTDAGRYRWTRPDGQTSKETNLSYPTQGDLTTDQALQFRLDAYSPAGNKSDYVVKQVTVKARRWQVTLYGRGNSIKFALFIDGQPKDSVTVPALDFNSPNPSCGAAGYPLLGLTQGAHVITLEQSGTVITKNVTINPNTCTLLQVY